MEETTRGDDADARVLGQPRWLRDERLDLRQDDQFGVDRLVDRLVQLLARAKPPFTLSLSGAWGVGKSTVADAIVDRLKEHRVRAVKIDAWTQDVAQLRRSVVIEVGAALASGSDDDRKALAEELDVARATQIEVQSARVEARGLWPTVRQIRRSWAAYLVLATILALSWYEAASLDKDAGLRPIFIALASVLSPVLVAAVAWRLVTPSTSRAPCAHRRRREVNLDTTGVHGSPRARPPSRRLGIAARGACSRQPRFALIGEPRSPIRPRG